MLKSELLHALQQEILRHEYDYFCTETQSVAQGGNGVMANGCVTCKKSMQHRGQFTAHLAYDVLPRLLDRLSSER